jgi:hypothetical protein
MHALPSALMWMPCPVRRLAWRLLHDVLPCWCGETYAQSVVCPVVARDLGLMR